MNRTNLGSLTPSQLNNSSRFQNHNMLSSDSKAKQAGSRRSSGLGKTQWKGDNRNLSDKAFQSRCQRKIEDYLTAQGFQISLKTLSSPTAKDFQNIVTFLLKLVDPNIRLSNKVEDDVPAHFKMLGYPFPISKGSLQSIGSPHSWPSILSALAWLVELLMLDNEFERQIEVQIPESDKIFLEYYFQSYGCFLSGNDEELEDLRHKMKLELVDIENNLDKGIEKLENEIEYLQKEIERESNEPSEANKMQDHYKTLLHDLSQCENRYQSLVNNNQNLSMEINSLREEIVNLDNALGITNLEKEEIQELINRQTFSKKDIERMKMEISLGKERVERHESQRASREQVKWKLEIEIEKGIENLEATVSMYNTMAQKLKLVPITAKRAKNMDFKIQLNKTAKSSKEMLAKNLKEEVNPALLELKHEYSRTANELESERMHLEEEMNECLSVLEEMNEEIASMECQIKKVEDKLRVEKEKSDASLKGLMKEIAFLESDMEESNTIAELALEETRERYMAKQKELETFQVQLNAENKEFYDRLQHQLEIIHGYKKHVEERLANMNHLLDSNLLELSRRKLMIL